MSWNPKRMSLLQISFTILCAWLGLKCLPFSLLAVFLNYIKMLLILLEFVYMCSWRINNVCFAGCEGRNKMGGWMGGGILLRYQPKPCIPFKTTDQCFFERHRYVIIIFFLNSYENITCSMTSTCSKIDNKNTTLMCESLGLEEQKQNNVIRMQYSSPNQILCHLCQRIMDCFLTS